MKKFSFDNIKEVTGQGCFQVDFNGKFPKTVADFGDIGYIAGAKGTFKTTWLESIKASALSGGQLVHNLRFYLGDKFLVEADTESSEQIFDKHQVNTYKLAGLPLTTHPQHISLNMTSIPDGKEKAAALLHELSKIGDRLGLLILDRIDNFLENPASDVEGSAKFVSWAKRVAQTCNCVVIGLTHTSESTDKNSIMTRSLYGTLGRQWFKASAFGFTTNTYLDTVELVPTATRYTAKMPRIRAVLSQDNPGTFKEVLDFMPW